MAAKGLKVEVGQKASYSRTFTPEDVKLFAELSGDKGAHHMRPDEEGKVMVQGLLTASIPTKIGGDLDFIAREFVFEFLRPVFVGDTIRCETVVTKADQGKGRQKVGIDIVCYNQSGKEVMVGRTSGVIPDGPRGA